MIARERCSWTAGLVAAFSLATAVCWVSNNLGPRVAHRDETVSQQRALLRRAPLTFDGQSADLPEFRNRILFPLAMITVAATTGITDRQAFLATRWVSAFACFGVLWAFALLVAEVDVPTALLAGTLLAVFFVLSFNHPWEHPTDFPDAIVMVAGTWAAVRRRFGTAAFVAMLGAANRESAAFVGVVWTCCALTAADRSAARALAEGVVLAVLSMAVTIGLRMTFGMPGSRLLNSVSGNPVLPVVVAALHHPFMSWAMILVAACMPAIVAIEWCWQQGSDLGRRVACAAIGIAAVSVVVGTPSELRILTPALAVGMCGMLLLWTPRITTARN